MPDKPASEVWMRGPVPDVPPLLQPVAHALLQVREEVRAHLEALSLDDLWARPGGAGSIGFHVRHAAGSLDRLFTYARGEALSAAQLASLKAEAEPDLTAGAIPDMLAAFDAAIDRALAQVRGTDPGTLLEPRGVGRAQYPSTVIGLLFHAAEHAQRHAGQIATTRRVLRGGMQTKGAEL